VQIAEIEYFADGRRLVGQLAVDDTTPGRRPAVLVCHEGNGLTDLTKTAARRLAELGYVAFALDYHGDGKPLPDDEVLPRFNRLASNPSLTRGLGRAGLDVLLASEYADPDQVAAIGYCFGGSMALELARGGADLRAVVGFHPGLATAAPANEAKNITGKVLVMIGSEDPIVPAEQRAAFEAEMRGAGVDWQMLLLGGCVHSFTNKAADAANNPAIRYDAAADARSWRAMLNLFDEVLVPPARA
jgi:dienelactone hydrolase